MNKAEDKIIVKSRIVQSAVDKVWWKWTTHG